MSGTASIPRIDVSSLVEGGPVSTVAHQIDTACREHGFFTITGHGISPALRDSLELEFREFFDLDVVEKAEVAMEHGGRAWRGWFGVGHELTSGVADVKEGIYFGTELPADDPRVQAQTLLHGANLWPRRPERMGEVVVEWMSAMTELAEVIMSAIAVGLGLDGSYFKQGLTADPTILFRAFRYPPVDVGPRDDPGWGVGEHTDYGLLTLLAQDDSGGLQVRTRSGWVDVEPDPEALVCNIGDMLDRLTLGRYRSTPHRVVASRVRDRVSFPFFYDPGWDALVEPIPLAGDVPPDDGLSRWDGTSLRDLSGTYGEYLSAKVGKVFPALKEDTERTELFGVRDGTDS